MEQRAILSTLSFDWLHHENYCSEESLKVLKSLGLFYLTKIQAFAICKIAQKHNLVIEAPTGTGKTLAYLLPSIERLKAMKFTSQFGVGCLMIFPTRELSFQMSLVVDPLVKAHGFTFLNIIGGLKAKRKLSPAGGTLTAATMGRLLDVLCNEEIYGKLVCKNLKILVVDEADAILEDHQHLKTLQKIMAFLPISKKTQIILASATVSKRMIGISKTLFAREFDVVKVKKECSTIMPIMEVDSAAQEVDTSRESFVHVKLEDRFYTLVEFLKTIPKAKVLIFCTTRHCVKFYLLMLNELKFNATACMGQMNQNKRLKEFQNFQDAKEGILLATGLADRGWDIPGITHIIQYDPPSDHKLYVHRHGRSGRGLEPQGESILFTFGDMNKYIEELKTQGSHLHYLEIKVTKETRERVSKAYIPAFQAQAIKGLQSFLASCNVLSKVYPPFQKTGFPQICLGFFQDTKTALQNKRIKMLYGSMSK